MPESNAKLLLATKWFWICVLPFHTGPSYKIMVSSAKLSPMFQNRLLWISNSPKRKSS